MQDTQTISDESLPSNDGSNKAIISVDNQIATITQDQIKTINNVELSECCNIELNHIKRRMVFHMTGAPVKQHVIDAMNMCLTLADKLPYPYDVVIDWKGKSLMTDLVGPGEKALIEKQNKHRNIHRYILCGGFPIGIRVLANIFANNSGRTRWFSTYEDGTKFLDNRPLKIIEQ